MLCVSEKKPGIFVVSHDNLKWLSTLPNVPKFDLFVVDESSKFRGWSTLRSKAARHLAARIPQRLLLTGTPCPNSPAEIFPQQVILDLGKTLGTTITKFRERYCKPGGFENREWVFRDSLKDQLYAEVEPYYLHQSAAEYLSIPAYRENIVRLDLPPTAKTMYKRMEEDLVALLKSGPLLAMGGSDRYRLTRQIASGTIYTSHPQFEQVHKEKVIALHDLLDEIGAPTIVAYQFNCERQVLQAAFPKSEAIYGQITPRETQQIIRRFTTGQTRLVFVQSQAVSHGIDGLQSACSDVVWYTLPDSGETYEQLIARVYRAGQTKTVCIHHLLATGTIDVQIYRLLKNKSLNQRNLLEALT
jgi:SNF2 family DNA or RNA helicase